MKYMANALILLGFCIGSLGATGFHNPALSASGLKVAQGQEAPKTGPDREDHAMLLFAIGLGTLLVGGFMARSSKAGTSMEAGEQHTHGAALLKQITAVQQALSELHAKASSLSPEERHLAISDLSEGAIYDLTSEFEHWIEVLGFERYSQVWTGIATGERLVNRAWSMETDGHAKEATEELGLAATAFANARTALGS